jgi:hypothetical protein
MFGVFKLSDARYCQVLQCSEGIRCVYVRCLTGILSGSTELNSFQGVYACPESSDGSSRLDSNSVGMLLSWCSLHSVWVPLSSQLACFRVTLSPTLYCLSVGLKTDGATTLCPLEMSCTTSFSTDKKRDRKLSQVSGDKPGIQGVGLARTAVDAVDAAKG